MSLLIKNVAIADVLEDEIKTGDIYIRNGRFEKIAEHIDASEIEEKEHLTVINGEGLTALPGLIDAHTHVELSMLSSASFAEALIQNGTTAAVLDPHDAVNVLGHKGAKYLMEEMKETDLTPVWMASPCVPSAPGYEDCYGQVMLSDVKVMVEEYGMYGIAEAMDYNRVIAKEASLKEILDYGKEKGLKIDGHAPGVLGADLDTYIAAGVSSDHENVTVEEMLEKFRKGMYVIIRRGSLKEPASAKEFLDKAGDSDHILLSTDGCITAKDMAEHGHMNYALAQIVKEGVEPLQAIKLATVYPAAAYGLKDRGVIAEGYRADMILVKNLTDFKVQDVIINGEIAKASYPRMDYPKEVIHSIKRDDLKEGELTIPLPEGCIDGEVKVNIVKIVDGTLETIHEERKLPVKNGALILEDDLMYCAVVDRYRKDGSIGIGIISQAGALQGAFAGSVGQDTQNLIAFGTSLSDMTLAFNQVIAKQGGLSYVRDGEEKQFVGLPVLGILSQKPMDVFVEETDRLLTDLWEHGCILKNPILTMSLQISLAVIPEMAITNRGLLDIINNRFIPVCELV